MAKRLTMAAVDTILTLHKAGHSNREIAALLGVNRETVGKHLARARAKYQPNAPTGNPTGDPNGVPAGSDGGDGGAGTASENPPDHPAGGAPPPARQAFQPTGREVNASRSGQRSWRRSSRVWRRCGFARIWCWTTATAPPGLRP